MTDMPEIHKPHEKTKTNFKTKKKIKQNKTKNERNCMRGNEKAWYKFL